MTGYPYIVTETLAVKLKPSEIKERLEDVARMIGNREELEEEKRQSAADYRERLKTLDAEILKFSKEARERQVYQPVDCERRRNEEKRAIDTVRLDTDQVIRSRPMTDEERQIGLFPVPDQEDEAEEA